MWIELISGWFPEAQFGPPAGNAQLDRAEELLGQPLPLELRQLLGEADGVRGEFLVNVIWDCSRIERSNAEFRSRVDFAALYAPFSDLIFFGDNGGGDQFAFHATDHQAGVFVWEHETDIRRCVAEDLNDYLRRSMTADGDDWYVGEQ